MARRGKSDIDENDDADLPEGKPSPKVRYWLAEIEAAKKREEQFRKDGVRIREIYAGEKRESTPFNILFSNTETMLPSMYSQAPRPVVQRRYKDDDKIGQAAATAGQRILEFLLDTNVEGYETFHDAMKSSTMDALLPGRGVATVKYDAEIEGEYKSGELVCAETQSWVRVYFGYARKWSKVPWIAYEMYVDKAEAKRLFGDKAAKLKFSRGEEDDPDDNGRAKPKDETKTGEHKTALVFQIWDKRGGKKVRYVSPAYPDAELKVEDDPLGLTGFFNMPRPIQFVEKTDSLTPTALYCLYENQAAELNNITVRINRLIRAVKARGIYDAALGDDIKNIMEAEDNELVPAEHESALATEKGLSNAIWFMPLEQIITTLRELYAAREAVKQVIYEIMGISDILRGASKASETLGAQQIKNTWGSLRLKPKQAEVQRFARDMLRLMLEIAAKKFSEDTWAKMTGLPYLTQAQARALMAQAQQTAQAAQMGDPQAAQAFQQLQQQVQQTVTWAAVLETLQNDMQRAYKIDIETNSTVEPDAVEDQKKVTELMTAVGQTLQGLAPLIAQGVLSHDAAKAVLMMVAKRFQLGVDLEEIIKNMMPPAPQQKEGQQGDPAAAVKAEAQVKKVELAAKEDKIKSTAEIERLKTQLTAMQTKLEQQQREFGLDIKELTVSSRENQVQANAKREREMLDRDKKQAVSEISTRDKLAAASSQVRDAKSKAAMAKTGAGKPSENGSGASESAGAVGPADSGAVPLVDESQAMQAVSEVTGIVQQLAQMVQQQSMMLESLHKYARAPRRKTPRRGPDGKIAEVIEEVVDPDSGETLQ